MRPVVKKSILIKDRVEFYQDFILNLIHYINKYSLDRESLSDDQDIKNHFNFCYNKVCDEFLLEEIDFRDNVELWEYNYAYFYNQYYISSNDQEELIEYFIKFWSEIFESKGQKNRNIINILIEIYGIFDTSTNQQKNIIEIG